MPPLFEPTTGIPHETASITTLPKPSSYWEGIQNMSAML